jgi:hypothetical protein
MSERMPHGPEIESLLVSQMRADLSKRPWYKRWYGRLSIAGAGLIVVGAAGIAGLALLTPEPVTDSFVVHCLSDAKLRTGDQLSGAAATVASSDGVLPIDDAIAMCEQMWEAGALVGADPLDPQPSPGVVPREFTLCVTDEGEAAVVPARIDCSALRLHPYQPNVPEGR